MRSMVPRMRTGGGSCAKANSAQTNGAANIAAKAIPNERANTVRTSFILPVIFWMRTQRNLQRKTTPSALAYSVARLGISSQAMPEVKRINFSDE